MEQTTLFGEEPRKTGTREWSVASVNFAFGCVNQCAYCFARANALRFKRIETPEAWSEMVVSRRPDRERRLYNGVVMIPTTHDIVPEMVDVAVEVLRNLLGRGNQVLIVSKPRVEVVEVLTYALIEHLDRVEFRFSIGSLDDDLARVWEPKAPTPDERVVALKMAHDRGYRTSVSMEPSLYLPMAVHDFKVLAPDCETIWIGKMNQIRRRVVGVSEEDIRCVEAGQTDEEVMNLYRALMCDPKVRWKDSIREVVDRFEVVR